MKIEEAADLVKQYLNAAVKIFGQSRVGFHSDEEYRDYQAKTEELENALCAATDPVWHCLSDGVMPDDRQEVWVCFVDSDKSVMVEHNLHKGESTFYRNIGDGGNVYGVYAWLEYVPPEPAKRHYEI
jgi:hypothetical protein